MRLATKLEEWRAAALIDASTVAAILAHEDRHRRPVALLAVAGLGVLALALGILLVVAANWDSLSPLLKLAVQLLLTLAAAAVAWRWRDGPVWAGEAALFLLAGLTLAGIALQAQVYQQNGELWQALGWWAVLAAPALLLLGRTRLIAAGLGGMLIALAGTAASASVGPVGEMLIAALPPALIVAALALPTDAARATFVQGLFELGLALALVAASAAQLAWVDDLDASDAWWTLQRAPLAIVLTVVACALGARRLTPVETALLAIITGGALAAVLIACGLPHGDGPAWRFAGLVVFAAYWGSIAAAASRAGWSRLFALAVLALSLRLFVVYFELFYSLAFTGVGLIVGGLLLIALTWGATRIVRRAGP